MENDVDNQLETKLFIEKEELKETKRNMFIGLLGEMSKFNAAEGTWVKDTLDRNNVKFRLKGLTTTLIENEFVTVRELKILAQPFLVKESEYLSAYYRINGDR